MRFDRIHQSRIDAASTMCAATIAEMMRAST